MSFTLNPSLPLFNPAARKSLLSDCTHHTLVSSHPLSDLLERGTGGECFSLPHQILLDKSPGEPFQERPAVDVHADGAIGGLRLVEDRVAVVGDPDMGRAG